jgi:ankyrin repeat protein
MCPKCGWHISLDDARPFQPLHTYKSDYFGNTALHFAARSPSPNLEFILQLIDGGANCNALNTSGQTFMHVLNERTTNYLKHVHCSIYLALLKKLQSHNFPFSHQDCHGRMLAHNLSPAVLASFMRSSSLPEILSILDINLNCVDNYGIDAGHGLGKSPEALPSDTIAPYWLEETEAIVATHRRLPKANISFRRTLLNPNLPKAKTKLRPTFLRRNKVVVDVVDVVDVWLNWVERENLTSWIDVHGDTPLTALLKMWPSEMQDESPLEHAVLQLILKNPNLVNMKDRKGYTPLAIAAIRGSERSMRYLLESGANFNSRNYRGKGIIAQASERMELAKKKGVNKCYTRILTCINLLVDKGAELNPTEFDEFLLPELRGKLDMASYLLHQ